MDISQIRYANLQLLVDQRGGLQKGGLAKLSRDLEKSQAQLSQIAGARPVKNVGTRLAREVEEKLGLPAGWMDSPQKAGSARVRDSETVAYLPSQPAGRGDVSLDIAGDAADDVAEYLGIDRSSRQYLALFQKIHQRVQSALESQVPANRLDFVVKPAARTTEETSNAERGPAEEVGARAGSGHQGAAAGKPGAKPRRKS